MADKIIISVPSEKKYLQKVSSAILDSLSPYGIAEEDLFNIRLCVEEAVRNAMVHGNKDDKDLSVEVTYQVESGKLVIEVEDKGKGFDPASVPDPTAGKNMLRTSGRGVYLIKRLMDTVEYNKAGNRIRMTKHLKI